MAGNTLDALHTTWDIHRIGSISLIRRTFYFGRNDSLIIIRESFYFLTIGEAVRAALIEEIRLNMENLPSRCEVESFSSFSYRK